MSAQWEYNDDDTLINIYNEYKEDIESDVYTIEIISSDSDVFDMVNLDDFAEGNAVFAISVDIDNDSMIASDAGTISNNVISTDGMIIDTDGTMNLYSVENLVTKDIYTYDNVDMAIDTGYNVLENYNIDEIASQPVNCVGIGMVKTGHYVIITSDNSDEDNKALTPYQCGRLLKEMGCGNGFCYVNSNISMNFGGEIILDNGIDLGDEASYLTID